jgi:hypothetical protein
VEEGLSRKIILGIPRGKLGGPPFSNVVGEIWQEGQLRIDLEPRRA